MPCDPLFFSFHSTTVSLQRSLFTLWSLVQFIGVASPCKSLLNCFAVASFNFVNLLSNQPFCGYLTHLTCVISPLASACYCPLIKLCQYPFCPTPSARLSPFLLVGCPAFHLFILFQSLTCRVILMYNSSQTDVFFCKPLNS